MKLHPAQIIFFAALIYFQCCTAKADKPVSDAIWLARSCIGEAGWNAYETGECIAILHVYKKRAAITGETVVQLAKRYSAAIKRRGANRHNRWVIHLDGIDEPKYWPYGANWKKYQMHWLRTWFQVVLFLNDKTVDPLPSAMHYGCKFDIPPPGSVRIKTKFRNRFYR